MTTKPISNVFLFSLSIRSCWKMEQIFSLACKYNFPPPFYQPKRSTENKKKKHIVDAWNELNVLKPRLFPLLAEWIF